MKKLLLSIMVLFIGLTGFAQRRLEKLWESDSLTLKGPESALFDAKSQSLYISSMGAGSVVQMDLNGNIMKSDLVKGLNANKGSGIYNGLFYTAETSAVAVIDLAKGAIIKRIPIEGAGMLNDLAIDSKGIVYVSDTRTGKVHRIEGDEPAVYLEGIPGANGLLTVGDDLYVVGSTLFEKVSSRKEITKIGDGYESGLDGIVMIAKDEFILSNYTGILYDVKADGTKQVLLDTRSKGVMSNDISYNAKTNTLYVPSFRTNRIIAYSVK